MFKGLRVEVWRVVGALVVGRVRGDVRGLRAKARSYLRELLFWGCHLVRWLLYGLPIGGLAAPRSGQYATREPQQPAFRTRPTR